MAAVFPVTGDMAAGALATTSSYSGQFIPELWSKKLNAKFYANTMLTEIMNTSWEGELKNQGDTVHIRTAPSITINDYQAGQTLVKEVPEPIMLDMQIDKGKYFAVQTNDVLAQQADMDLMNMFTDDAAKQLKIACENEVFYNCFITEGAAAANTGTAAGAISGSYNMGADADASNIALTDTLNTILEMAAILDEQNVPEDGRFLVITPSVRNALMSSNIAQAYFSGDSSSIVRTGKIGMLDRFTVYVSNLLPRAEAGFGWNDGLGTLTPGADAGTGKRQLIVAGTKAACAYAGTISKTEPLRNQDDFGDIVRGLHVYGRKVVKPEALVTAIMAAD